MSNRRRISLADAGIQLGRTTRFPHQRLMGTHEDTIVMYAGPRKGKTAAMSAMLLDAPGFALSTSTRPDVWGHTSIPRARGGRPILTLDVDPFSGIGSSLAWDMLDGCMHPSIAIERAGYLIQAAPKNSSGDHGFWDHQSAVDLRRLLHAGELCGNDLLGVRAWAQDPATKEPASVLYNAPAAAPGWAEEQEAFSRGDPEFQQSVTQGVLASLDWLSDPMMADIACPSPEKTLDVWKLMEEGGTVYLIGANKPHGSIAAYCAALTSHVWETGKRKAARSPGFRLDPPALFCIDEPAITCPVPLDKWLAEAGGWNMPVVTGVQSPAQLIRQWGPEGARIIRDCATIEMVFGGSTDAAELESLSTICGFIDTWEHVPGTKGKQKQAGKERLYLPERIKGLDEGRAIVLHRSARPVEADAIRVWDLPGYEPAEIAFTEVPSAIPVFPDGTPVLTGNVIPEAVNSAPRNAVRISERNN